MKKIVSILLTIMLVLAVGGCGNKNKQADEKNEKKAEQVKEQGGKKVITLWVHSGKPEEQAEFIRVFDAFNEKQDEIELKYTTLPEGSYNEQVNSATLSGDLPDVLIMDGPNMSNYAWAGYLLPLDDFMSEELKSDLLSSILAQGKYNGKTYCLGSFDSGLAIWGNKKYLEKAGVRIPKSVEKAWTLDEFNAALEKLKALPEVKYPLDIKLNYGQGEWYTYGFSPIVQSFGGDLIDREKLIAKDTLNGPKSVEALTWFQNLVKKEYVDPAPSGDDSFYGKKTAALSFVGHWMKAPHVEGLGDDLVLMPMPKFGDKVVTGMGSWAWGISANTKEPEAAWKVVEYLLSKESVKSISEAAGAVPSRKSVLAEIPEYQKDGLLYIFREQLEGGYSVERPTTPAYPVITQSFAEAFQNIITGSDVKSELDRAAETIDQNIKDNNFYK